MKRGSLAGAIPLLRSTRQGSVERVEKLDRDKLVDRKDKGKPSNEDRL